MVQRETAGKPAIIIRDNYDHSYHLEMLLTCIVRNNTLSSDIQLDIPRDGTRKKVNLVVENNIVGGQGPPERP